MTKKIKQNYMAYIAMLLAFSGLMLWILHKGSLYPSPATFAPAGNLSSGELFSSSLVSNLGHPLSLLLLQIIAILVAVRIFAFVFKYLGQPGVIGEIVAGIVLGPSLLGYLFPEVFAFLFAPDSLVSLNIISQIGLILFMFVIGMELNMEIIKKKASQTLVISHASIVVPFLLGLLLAYFIYPQFGAHSPFLPFALFIAISMSITAFPVLARIIQERNLSKTQMGMLAIASAANNDVTAWCMLAAIIAIAKAGNVASALYTILLSAAYIILMFKVVRPFLKKLGEIYNNPEIINKTFVSFIFLMLILSSYITEVLGIHALFGAFLAGVIMPNNLNFRRVITDKVEDVALVLFLPLFFVFTGLRTEIGLLNTPELWGMCGIFIAVSIVGKLLGASLSARFVGETWKDSLSIGVLMNTRGLMELIVLNIGFEMGIIPSSLFVIFVIMALFTTFMATPSLALIERLFTKHQARRSAGGATAPRILISFGNPHSGQIFLSLIHLLCRRNIGQAKLTAIHYTIGTDTNPLNAAGYSSESFSPLQSEALRLGLNVQTKYKVTDHYIKELIGLAKQERSDFVLVGGGPNFIDFYVNRPQQQLSSEQKLANTMPIQRWRLRLGLVKNKPKILFRNIHCTLGVFVNRGFEGASRIGVLLCDAKDGNLLPVISSTTPEAQLSLMVTGRDNSVDFEAELSSVLSRVDGHVEVCAPDVSIPDFVQGKELILISYANWLEIAETNPQLITILPSFVVIKPSENFEAQTTALK